MLSPFPTMPDEQLAARAVKKREIATTSLSNRSSKLGGWLVRSDPF